MAGFLSRLFGSRDRTAPHPRGQTAAAPAFQMSEDDRDRAFAVVAALALANPHLVSRKVRPTLEAMLGELDRAIGEQSEAILRHPALGALEAAWRGLKHVAAQASADPVVKVRALDLSRDELPALLAPGTGSRPRLERLLADPVDGGEDDGPCAAVVLDTAFGHGADDVSVLRDLAGIAARRQTVFIAAAAPGLLGLHDFGQFPPADHLADAFATPDHAGWNALRAAGESRYLALCLPGICLEPGAGQAGRWINPAFAMAANMARAFTSDGMPVNIRGIESGGRIGESPPSSDREPPMMEVAIDDRREAALARLGLNAPVWRQGAGMSYLAAVSLCDPEAGNTGDPERLAERMLQSRLPYTLFCSRWAYYVMRIAASHAGPLTGPGGLEEQVGTWLARYTNPRPETYRATEMAERPLAVATFRVNRENGSATGELALTPQYLLKGLPCPLRISFPLPRPAD